MKKMILLKVSVVLGFLISLAPHRALSQQVWSPDYSIGTVTGNYNFPYTQIPDQLVEIYPAAIPNTGLTYLWYSGASPIIGNLTSTGVTTASYSFTQPLTQTTYFYRKAFNSSGASVSSNLIKINVVSVNWEDYNYVREHDVDTINITGWTTVDQLPIGEKMQSTKYLDGLGRPLESVSRQTATPAQSGDAWGDLILFHQYDVYGREPKRYLPYSTTTQSGKFKTTQLTEQPQYYTNVYNETSAFDTITFDNSPLNRISNLKESGTSWAKASGDAVVYDVNSTTDSVQIWTVDYVQGDAPVNKGGYPANTLYKLSYSDENGNKMVEYTNMDGKMILKKVQLAPNPSPGHAGWICTYFVYDDFDRLCYQIQPVGVQYLNSNNWSFSGTIGATILAEQCFQYYYDNKGRTIWKKAPGIAPLNMLYDIRDRMVFEQDGNQATLSTPQWAATLYDPLDRPTEKLLYNTIESISSLETDINNAVTTTTVNIPANTQPTATNLVVGTRNTAISQYLATNSITFVPDSGNGFVSVPNDNFVAKIDPLPSSPGYSGTVMTIANPISAANLANSSVTTVLKYLYYDNYSFPGVKSFNTNFTNSSAYSTSNPDILPIATDPRTFSMSTGSQTLVLGTSIYLNETLYYDEKGNLIQTQEDNIKSGVDVTTQQHHFDGRVMSACENHSTQGTGYSNFITLTEYVFDILGRVTSIQKQYASNPMKSVSVINYDDVGRPVTKHLDPNYNNPNSGGPDLESLNYTYNIHNQITGINKDYALKNPSDYSKWGHFFGLYLGYDNRDGVFNAAQLNGQVTGQMWNTQGDDAQRKYDYTYDNSNRLINAAYKEQQQPGDGWSNSTMDFSVSGTSGQISYDLNGNLLTMLQRGIIPGNGTPITIDDLRYAYQSDGYSNKLQSVTDMMTSTSVNGLNGDFKDGSNAAGTPDYVYDNNGNLLVDLNKNIQSLNNGAAGSNGLHYNFLDKPDQIRLVGQGTINIVYSADGEKLQRVFIPETGGLSTVTTYVNEFVYQSRGTLTLSSTAPFTTGTTDTLNYINFEEGRIRVMTPTNTPPGLDVLTENGNLTLPNAGTMGVWDYFIKDYQSNVRMILTEETHSAVNTCTMETNRASVEDPIFGQTGAANEVEATRVQTPSGWQSVNSSASVSELGNIFGHNVGPNSLQKVMAGDMVTASAQYYYQSASNNTNPNILQNILNSLGGAIGGPATAGTLIHGSASAIAGELGNSSPFISAVEPVNPPANTPQAYLTILFFDERFNLVAAENGGVVQQQVASTWTTNTQPLSLNGQAPKNGYAYVYVSNLSDQSVYFDNLVLGITAGNIIEEEHYYAFGLKIAGISSKKLGDTGEGTLKNNYLYNDKEFFDDGGLDWYDYGFRNYDPQIGRFVEVDPLTDDYPFLSPYQYAGNDPVGNIDQDGLDVLGAVGGAVSGGSEFFQGSKTVDQAAVVVVAAIRPAVQAAVITTQSLLSITSILLNTAITATNIIAKTNTVAAGDHDAIYAKGMRDAIHNAVFLGIPHLTSEIGYWGHDPVDDYDNDADREAYLNGRAAGDALYVLAAAVETHAGAGAAGGGLATGPGALVISTGGLLVAGHGLVGGTAASVDALWVAAEAVKYGLILKASSDGPVNDHPQSNPPQTNPSNNSPPTVKFSQTPKASELRNWAKSKGYKLLSDENGIEVWGEDGQDGWRLKIKEPSKTPGIDPGSQKWRFSARTKPGEYYNPVTGQTGTRAQYGHLDVDPN